MRRGTRVHADQAPAQLFEECQHRAAPELLPNDHLFGRVDPVNRKHVLGNIQTDRGNLHVDGSPHVIRFRRNTLWHFDAGSGRRPPHQTRTSADMCDTTASPPEDGVIGWQLVDSSRFLGAALQADGETRSVVTASSIRRRSAAWTILLDWTFRSRRRVFALWMTRSGSCGK